MKILLSIPSYNGDIKIELVPFLQEAHQAIFFPVSHRPIDVARNQAVHEAQQRHCDVLVMVDADMAPCPGSFAALVEQALKEVCVVGCPYQHGGGLVAIHETPGCPLNLAKLLELEGLQSVANMGTGLVAYNMAVFSKITPPFFEHTYNSSHTCQTGTEDHVCHAKLREAGVPLYVHFDYWSDHVKNSLLGKPVPFLFNT